MIRNLQQWQDLAPPKSAAQWRRHRSACELARSWLSGQGEAALVSLLKRTLAASVVEFQKVSAEHETRFDGHDGPRYHDLLVSARADGRRIVIGVEGKATEEFGQTLDGYAKAAARKQARNEPTNAPARLCELVEAFTGSRFVPGSPVGRLRYQLFTASAGVIAEADLGETADGEIEAAVLLVQQLRTPAVSDSILKRNRRQLDEFLSVVFGVELTESRPGLFAGPLNLHSGTSHLSAKVPLYVAKIETSAASYPERCPE